MSRGKSSSSIATIFIINLIVLSFFIGLNIGKAVEKRKPIDISNFELTEDNIKPVIKRCETILQVNAWVDSLNFSELGYKNKE